MNPTDEDARLNRALSAMKGPGHWWWAENVRIFNQEGPRFMAQVDAAKTRLAALPNRNPLRSNQEATSLRVRLEQRLPGYFGKAMLAVALVEMGYSVVYVGGSPYFRSNFPRRCWLRAL